MNPIVAENQLTGTDPSVWDIADTGDGTYKYGDPAIQGYAVPFSVNLGLAVTFKIKLASIPITYHIDIYRLGYYGGKGARLVATIPSSQLDQSQTQLPCGYDGTTRMVDCGNWLTSATWTPTAPLISGVYIAKLVREDAPSKASHIVFVVREDSRASDILVQTSDTTWQAYNTWGDAANGAGFYNQPPSSDSSTRAYKVSYNRPFNTRLGDSRSFAFSSEFPMWSWLEMNGYDVTYCAGMDTDAGVPSGRRVFLSVGHDEYWSKAQRENVEAARNGGMNLAFFSGNECYWKTRWENDASGQKRTLVCYKETWGGGKIDQTNPAWTGTWRDPRGAAFDGGLPENALTGTLSTVINEDAEDSIGVMAQHRRMRFWRFTPISTLDASAPPSVLSACTLGYEWDEDLDNGFRPPFLTQLSSATLQKQGVLSPPPTPGNNDGAAGDLNGISPRAATHSLTLYKHSNGALVFGAGTSHWSWGLPANHDAAEAIGPDLVDANISQATVNLLCDMGAVPSTLAPGLTLRSASLDTEPPVTVITSPVAGANLTQGVATAITGTATDAAGVVGAVEVSWDGGSKWHPASTASGSVGLESWTYPWTPATTGAVTVKARSADDSMNQETPGASVAVNVVAAAGGQSLWPGNPVPSIVTVNDPSQVELGVRFQSSQAGKILGIRFYKGPQNTGAHVGTLWDAAGHQLAQVTFTGETASGWQRMNFPTPVDIAANTVYVASYHTSGFYSANSGYFTSAYTSGPLTALASGAIGNGLYLYGAGGFPTETSQQSNYWVDVLFQ